VVVATTTVSAPTGAEKGAGGGLRTPVRLALALAVAVLALLAAGAAGAVTLTQRQSTATSTTYAAEPLAVYVQQLYQDLADADTAAAASILAGPVPPTVLTNRYNSDIADAEGQIAFASRALAGDDTASNNLAAVSAFLPRYTALIGIAEADNRLGYPVGAAYLRTASNYLQKTTLPQVKAVEKQATDTVSAGSGQVSGFPIALLVFAIVAAIAIVRIWRMLARTTRRTVNPGLASGALITAGVMVWAFAAALTAGDSVKAANGDFATVSTLLNQRSQLARAQADQALTLIDRGEDGGADQKDEAAALTALSGANGAQWAAFNNAVTSFKQDVAAANYAQAVDVTLGTGSSAGNGATFAAAATVDNTLMNQAEAAQKQFLADGQKTVSDLSGGLWVCLLTGLAAAALAAYGVNRRMAEYR
jgi:hypothetical protein